MAVTVPTRLAFRGIVRANHRVVITKLNALLFYDVKHPTNPVFTPSQITEVENIITQLEENLAERVPRSAFIREAPVNKETAGGEVSSPAK